jgi:Cu(I)/Ag(I) efflux system membrane fusion protein
MNRQLLLVLTLLFFSVQQIQAENPFKIATVEQLFSVQTIKVAKTQNSKRMSFYGYVKEDESRVHDVTPRFGGYVVRLYADKIFAKVKKGDPLVSIYSPEVFQAKDEYLNAYRYAQKRPNIGMLKSSRLKLELLGISEEEINKVVSSGVASATTTVYSPVDGYIFKKKINKGSAFTAKEQLFQIVNLDEVWVEALVIQEHREAIEQVEQYEMTFKGIRQNYMSKQALLYPRLDPNEATLMLRINVKNSKRRLLPGMYANIDARSLLKQELTLPNTAVIRKNGKYYVFMVGDFKGEYEPKEIKADVINADRYRIVEGLQEGDEVVNNALFMMDADAQINGLY